MLAWNRTRGNINRLDARNSMTQFVRMHADQKIVEVNPKDAQHLIANGAAGPTATIGILQFLTDWVHPTSGKRYHSGDFEKFDVNVPDEKAIAAELQTNNIARAIIR
jgi:hypothetical protein